VLTFGADGMTFHSDHIAIHHWVTSAWRRCGHPGELLYAAVTVDFQARFRDQFEEWDMYMSDERPVGVPVDGLAVHTHLAGIDLDRKLTALGAMSTQTRGLLEMLGVETYAAQVAEEAFVAARRDTVVAARSGSVGAGEPEDVLGDVVEDHLL
jgi:LmbE family N-acetylglucosaminyl deacetylase